MSELARILSEYQVAITFWLGAICTLGIFSILYKENPYYRVLEHVFIGLATGQTAYITWAEVLRPRWWNVMVLQGQWWWAFALPAGLMFYFVISKKHVWISRLMFGILMGLGCGLAFQGFANTMFPQIRESFKPIFPVYGVVSSPEAINNLIFVVILVTVMSYFFFSIDHKSRSMRGTAMLGRWFLMFAFGAMFGSTVMARMALFIGRVDFMVNSWGPIVPLWFWMVASGVILLLIGYFIFGPKPPKKKEGILADETPEEVTAEVTEA